MTATDRSRRQSTTDHTTRPDRIQALTRDLIADLDYYKDGDNDAGPCRVRGPHGRDPIR